MSFTPIYFFSAVSAKNAVILDVTFYQTTRRHFPGYVILQAYYNLRTLSGKYKKENFILGQVLVGVLSSGIHRRVAR
jgi:hypothetical protein